MNAVDSINLHFERVCFFQCDVGFKNQGLIYYSFNECAFVRCNYGAHISDLVLMHGGCGWFEHCNWYGCDQAGLYVSGGVEQLKIDHAVIQGCGGFGIFADNTYAGWTLRLNDVYFEVNGAFASVDIDSVSYTPRDLYLNDVRRCIVSNSKMSNVAFDVVDSTLELDGCYWYESDIADSGTSLVLMRNMILDGPYMFNWYTEDFVVPPSNALGKRAAMALSPIDATIDYSMTNIWTDGSCAVSFTPTDAQGQAYSFEDVDAPMFNRVLKVTLDASLTYANAFKLFSHSTVAGKYYVYSYDIKADGSDLTFEKIRNAYDSSFITTGSGAYDAPISSSYWTRYFGITYELNGGTQTWYWWNTDTSSATFYLSAMQCIQFDTFQEAIRYLRTRRYAWPSSLPTMKYDVTAADSVTRPLYTATVDLTSAQVKALKATPIELVAAQGAGTVIEFVSAILVLDYGGTNVFTESADNLVVEYDSGGAAACSQTIEMTGFIDQSADTITNALASIDALDASADIVNKNIALVNNNDEIAGNAGADNALRVIVTYRVHDSLGL